MQDIRLRRRMSQDAVAAATGIAQARVSRIERGTMKPTAEEAAAIAHALAVPVDLLWPPTPQPADEPVVVREGFDQTAEAP
jgi:transcriptional regulator with XRE-family HTH domain